MQGFSARYRNLLFRTPITQIDAGIDKVLQGNSPGEAFTAISGSEILYCDESERFPDFYAGTTVMVECESYFCRDMLPEDKSQITITIKRSSDDTEILKKQPYSATDDGTVIFVFQPDDTKLFKNGVYIYEIVRDADGVINVIDRNKLRVREMISNTGGFYER